MCLHKHRQIEEHVAFAYVVTGDDFLLVMWFYEILNNSLEFKYKKMEVS